MLQKVMHPLAKRISVALVSSSKKPSKAESKKLSHHDWFAPAIRCEGTVGDSLQAVADQLDFRRAFVKALKTQLVVPNSKYDRITILGQKLRSLESTLKARIPLLNPEREASWFRVSARQNIGPFAVHQLTEAVFFPFSLEDTQKVRKEIRKCWEEKTELPPPPGQRTKCLWGMLLEMQSDYVQISKLPNPFTGLSFDNVVELLPKDLESDCLVGFLNRISSEMAQIRDRLDGGYDILHEASERFWRPRLMKIAEARAAAIGSRSASTRKRFKEKREANARSAPNVRHGSRLTRDQDAMKFMGFALMPSREDLKKRYIDLAKRHHPDRAGGSEEVFKRLTTAYRRLSQRVSG